MMNVTSVVFRQFARIVVLPVVLLIPLQMVPAAQPQEHSKEQGHAEVSSQQPQDMADVAKMRAKFLADKRESEFNHRLAGLFVIAAGSFMLFHLELAQRWRWSKYIWPAIFLISGVFLTVWSDTELWPFGQRRWIEAIRDNPEVRQHKTYALLLLILGVIEWLRASESVRAAWSRWVFPFTAIAGSVLLLFHQHDGGMQGPNHMAVMERIQSEHLGFAVVGFGIGLTNIVAGAKGTWRGVFSKLWPLLMLVLGLLLLSYRE